MFFDGPFGDKFDDDRIIEIISKNTPLLTDPTALAAEIDVYKIKIATARCARVSYLNFEGKDDYVKDIELHDILANSGHWSPFEHCAKAMEDVDYNSFAKGEMFYSVESIKKTSGWCNNFKGFMQYRYLIENNL